MTNEELIAEARDVLGRVNTNAVYHDSLFQYRGGVLVRELTLIVRDLADALEAAEARIAELEAGIEWEYVRQNRYGSVCEPDDSREQAEYRASMGGGYDTVVLHPLVWWEPVESEGDEA